MSEIDYDSIIERKLKEKSEEGPGGSQAQDGTSEREYDVQTKEELRQSA